MYLVCGAAVHSSYMYVAGAVLSLMQPQSPESPRDSYGTDSSVTALSPVPGSGLWDSEVSEVELMKGMEGLGFSILDFSVSHTG